MSIDEYYVQNHANICFECKNACGGCSWSAVDPVTNKIRFEPVEGWTAIKKMINLGVRGKQKAVWQETYFITECPEYISDERVLNE